MPPARGHKSCKVTLFRLSATEVAKDQSSYWLYFLTLFDCQRCGTAFPKEARQKRGAAF